MADWAEYNTSTLGTAGFPAEVQSRDFSVAKMNYDGDSNIPTDFIEINPTSNQPFRRSSAAQWEPMRFPIDAMPLQLTGVQKIIRSADFTVSSGFDSGLDGLTTDSDGYYAIKGYIFGNKPNNDTGNIIDFRVTPNAIEFGSLHVRYNSFDAVSEQSSASTYSDIFAQAATTFFGFSFEGVFKRDSSGSATVEFYVRTASGATGTITLSEGCFAEITKLNP